jgi:hypothetical protein
MNKILTLTLGLVLCAGIVGCKQDTAQQSTGSMKTNDQDSMHAQPTTKLATSYTCTMHPDVVSDRPGYCPKCGMTLVAKK